MAPILISLSCELDIRLLPLKTLLVYLDMEGIIKPRHTRFDEYAFKSRVEPADIPDRFDGERREFVRVTGGQGSVLNVTKFLCGVSSPALKKLHARKLSHFGVFEAYPFLEVRRWVSDHLRRRP